MKSPIVLFFLLAGMIPGSFFFSATGMGNQYACSAFAGNSETAIRFNLTGDGKFKKMPKTPVSDSLVGKTSHLTKTISNVTITSNNIIPSLAKPGDTVTVNLVASENSGSFSVTIATHPVSVTYNGGNCWKASYRMSQSDQEGVVPFKIQFGDTAGNSGAPIVASTDLSVVIFDKTAPAVLAIIRDQPLTDTIVRGPLRYRVILSENVPELDTSNFSLFASATARGTITGLSLVSPTEFDLVVGNVSGKGSLRPDLTYITGLSDFAGNAMTDSFTNGESYMLDPNHAPVFVHGSTTDASICSGMSELDLGALLAVNDSDAGQTLTWSIAQAPTHGSVSCMPATAASGGTTMPAGIKYIPSPGYSGPDSLTITVADSVAYDSITIHLFFKRSASVAIGAPRGTVLCAGMATLPLTASGEGQFCWKHNGVPVKENHSKNLDVNAAGEYSVVNTDFNGCVAEAENTIIVTAVNSPKAAFSYSVNCNTVTLNNLSDTMGAGVVTYVWYDGNAGISTKAAPVFSYSESGNYRIKLKTTWQTCGAFSDSAENIVSVEKVSGSIVAVHGNILCGGAATLPLIASGKGTYVWTRNGVAIGSNNTNKLMVKDPGVYSVAITGNSGCTVVAANDITISQITAPKAAFSCVFNNCTEVLANNLTDVNGVDGVTFLWGDGNGHTSGEVSPIFNYKDSGRYVIKLVAISQLCPTLSDSAMQEVVIESLSGAIDAPSGTVLCGKTATLPLIARGSNYYQWQRNGETVAGKSGNELIADKSGIYTVRLIGKTGCSVDADNSLVITESILPRPTFEYSLKCEKLMLVNTTDLTGNGTVHCWWSDSDGNSALGNKSTFTYLRSGEHAIKLKIGTPFCPGLFDSSIQIIKSETTVPAIRMKPVDTRLNEPVQLQARSFGTKYHWSRNAGLSNPNSSTPVAVTSVEKEYTVRIETATGCETVDTLIVRVFEDNVYVPHVFTPNGDGQNDRLIFNLVGIAQLRYIRVFNRLGKLMFETRNEKDGWDGRVNGVAQPQETYIWIVNGADLHGRAIQKEGSVTLLR